jgi:glycerol kinase
MILSIDQGTTSSRAVIYDPATFQVRGVAQREITQAYPKPGWVEHNADEIWQTVGGTVTEAISQANISTKQIATIGITNQRETIVVWDRDSGNVLAPAIVWQDRRTTAFCEEHNDSEPMLAAKTGLVLDPYFSATKLAWLLEQYPEIRSAAESGQAIAGTIDSFLLWRLTGGQVHATDVTNASRTLLFNINTFTWDEELCRFFNIPMSMLPTTQPSSSHFGTTRGLSFLPDGIRISGSAGDQQAALFGQGAHTAGEAKCTYGTGAFFLMHTGEHLVRSTCRLLTTLSANRGSEKLYALEGSIFVAGAAVQWLRDGLTLFTHAEQTEAFAEQSNPEEPVLFVPAFVGLGAPHWSPKTRGAIFGLTRSTKKADVARAALEGVAYQVAELVQAAQSECTKPLESLRVDGGMSRNDWFLKRQADILGVPVLKAAHSESTALGAAMLAGIEAGVCASGAELRQRLGTPRSYTATWDDATRQKKLARWRRAIKAVIELENDDLEA